MSGKGYDSCKNCVHGKDAFAYMYWPCLVCKDGSMRNVRKSDPTGGLMSPDEEGGTRDEALKTLMR